MLPTTPLHNIQLWKAEVIDPSSEEGLIRFATLKSKGLIHSEIDTLESQVVELAIIRNPSLKDNPLGLTKAIGAIIGNKRPGIHMADGFCSLGTVVLSDCCHLRRLSK